MKLNLREKLRIYFDTKSKFKIASDIIFYILLILLFVPVTRREIISNVKRLTLMKPRIEATPSPVSLNADDYLFSFEDKEGEILTISDYSGEVLFINFWATWCPPCRAEMPSIQRLYNEFHNKVNFLMITGEKPDPVIRYLEQYNYSFPVFFQRAHLTSSFKVSAIPHTYIIDRKGNTILSKTGAAKWDAEEFKEYLNMLTK